jgi:hypothetical protein
LYRSNGDILLCGPEQLDPQKPGEARVQCWLYVLDRSGMKPAVPLDVEKARAVRPSPVPVCSRPGS